MPTYVYECSKCNTQFEVEQRMIEPALDKCPCGSVGTVKRIIQPAGIMFKGSGFHINDYSAKPPPSEEPAATPTSPPVAETPAVTTDAGPTAAPAKDDNSTS